MTKNKDFFTLILLILFLISCSTKKMDSPNKLCLLDLSDNDGWFKTTSFYVDSTKSFRLLEQSSYNDNQYYFATLNDTQFQTISNIIISLDSLKIDTFYNGQCNDCGFTKFIINTKNKQIKSFISGSLPDDRLDSLVFYLFYLSKKLNLTKTDKEFPFKSNRCETEVKRL